MNTQQVWLVTGASKGLGLMLVKLLLENGHKVAATSRNVNDLKSNIGEVSGNFLPIELDITKSESVAEAVEQTIAYFGRLDVAVNNAGFPILEVSRN